MTTPSEKAATATPLTVQGEWLRTWEGLPHKGFFFALLAVWVVLFHWLGNSTLGYANTPSLFGWWLWMVTRGVEWRQGWVSGIGQCLNTEEAHVWIIPIVVLGLLWWKRAELLALRKGIWWPALGWLALALGAHIFGFMIQQTRVSLVGFVVGIYALTGLVWGRAWMRAVFFPFALFIFCVPLGPAMTEFITFPLRMLVTKFSVAVAHGVLGIDVVRDGSRIFDPQGTFRYEVAPACSGIRSLVTLTALTTIYGFLTFQKNWKRWLMVFLAVPLAVLGNTVRITCVIIAGEAFGQAAGAWIEQKLGFITFAVALAAVLLAGRWLREDTGGATSKFHEPDSAAAALGSSATRSEPAT